MIRWVPAPSFPGLRAVPTNEVCLYRDFATAGLLDGCTSGVWLLAALAALAEYPAVLRKCFPDQGPGLAANGEYVVRLFDPQTGEEQQVTVNDLVPVHALAKHGTCLDNWTPLFAASRGAEVYLGLIEKACAKLLGSYAELEKGTALFALSMLTGTTETYCLQQQEDEWLEIEVTESSSRFGYRGSDRAVYDNSELFHRLSEVVWPNGHVIGASAQAADSDPVLPCGLVAGHVYGVRRLISGLRRGLSRDVQLVQLRNPWRALPGKAGQAGWTGPWSP